MPDPRPGRRRVDPLRAPQTDRVVNLTFDERLRRLTASLGQVIALLRAHGEDRWADWLQATADGLSSGDARALAALRRSSAGGMGSFADLVIHPLNGHEVAAGELDAVNRRLTELRESVSHDATALQRELE